MATMPAMSLAMAMLTTTLLTTAMAFYHHVQSENRLISSYTSFNDLMNVFRGFDIIES